MFFIIIHSMKMFYVHNLEHEFIYVILNIQLTTMSNLKIDLNNKFYNRTLFILKPIHFTILPNQITKCYEC